MAPPGQRGGLTARMSGPAPGWSSQQVTGAAARNIAAGISPACRATDEAAWRSPRVDDEDVMTAARELQGLERMDQVKYAVLERNGGISIVPKKP